MTAKLRHLGSSELAHAVALPVYDWVMLSILAYRRRIPGESPAAVLLPPYVHLALIDDVRMRGADYWSGQSFGGVEIRADALIHDPVMIGHDGAVTPL